MSIDICPDEVLRIAFSFLPSNCLSKASYVNKRWFFIIQQYFSTQLIIDRFASFTHRVNAVTKDSQLVIEKLGKLAIIYFQFKEMNNCKQAVEKARINISTASDYVKTKCKLIFYRIEILTEQFRFNNSLRWHLRELMIKKFHIDESSKLIDAFIEKKEIEKVTSLMLIIHSFTEGVLKVARVQPDSNKVKKLVYKVETSLDADLSQMARILFNHNLYEDAIIMLQKIKNQNAEHHLFKALILEKLGNKIEAQMYLYSAILAKNSMAEEGQITSVELIKFLILALKQQVDLDVEIGKELYTNIFTNIETLISEDWEENHYFICFEVTMMQVDMNKLADTLKVDKKFNSFLITQECKNKRRDEDYCQFLLDHFNKQYIDIMTSCASHFLKQQDKDRFLVTINEKGYGRKNSISKIENIEERARIFTKEVVEAIKANDMDYIEELFCLEKFIIDRKLFYNQVADECVGSGYPQLADNIRNLINPIDDDSKTAKIISITDIEPSIDHHKLESLRRFLYVLLQYEQKMRKVSNTKSSKKFHI